MTFLRVQSTQLLDNGYAAGDLRGTRPLHNFVQSGGYGFRPYKFAMKKQFQIKNYALRITNFYRLCFGLIELLSAVKSRVSREHIAYSDSNGIIRQTVHSEKLAAEDYRGKRAVRNAAEHRDKTYRCTE